MDDDKQKVKDYKREHNCRIKPTKEQIKSDKKPFWSFIGRVNAKGERKPTTIARPALAKIIIDKLNSKQTKKEN